MSTFWALLRRELSSFFFALTGYVIIAAVAASYVPSRGAARAVPLEALRAE